MADAQLPKKAVDIDREQEELFKAKYGGLKPKKKFLAKEPKQFFDSADWALAKEAKKSVEAPESPDSLPPKLEPTVVPPRRVSKLDPSDA